jgi:hypothetical protein
LMSEIVQVWCQNLVGDILLKLLCRVPCYLNLWVGIIYVWDAAGCFWWKLYKNWVNHNVLLFPSELPMMVLVLELIRFSLNSKSTIDHQYGLVSTTKDT